MNVKLPIQLQHHKSRHLEPSVIHLLFALLTSGRDIEVDQQGQVRDAES